MRTFFIVILVAGTTCGFSQTVSEAPNDASVFLEGRDLLYNSQYEAARSKFDAYSRAHLASSFGPLYAGYAILFANNKKKFADKNVYETLRQIIDPAIKLYEAQGCDPNDLAIGGPTIDCLYIGAALYSFRMVLIGQNEARWKARPDKNHFLDCVEKSKSPQALFLFGIAEYEASIHAPFPRWIARRNGIPTEREEALQRVRKSLERNASPFLDEVSFFIFDTEKSYLFGDKKPDEPDDTPHAKIKKDESLDQLLEKFPIEKIREELHQKYPDNKDLVPLPSG